jgi:co-chaperonin GroES (HSP10)
VLVHLVQSNDRTETGLYLPQGTKESHAEALLGEVVEVARTLPKAVARAATSDGEGLGERVSDEEPGFGENVSGIPLGAQVLFAKDKGVVVPWDERLRIVDVRHILAIVDVISPDEIQ